MENNIEILKLPAGAAFKLCQILDDCGWKDVMSIIPSNCNDINSPPKYKAEHIRIIESYAESHNRSYSEIVLQEWGTSGRERPKLSILRDVLSKAGLFRASDFVSEELLKEPPSIRPSDGPAALVNTNLDDLPIPNFDTQLPVSIPPEVEENTQQLMCLSFTLLSLITNEFSDIPFSKKFKTGSTMGFVGNKLGAGAFGAVYFGLMPDGTQVAVKKLMNDTVSLFKQFQTEITTLSTYQHPNLLPLLGYSCDTPNYCLVYEFMPNRSLEDRLAGCTDDEKPLHWRKRLDVAIGVCKGIHYLHTAKSPPLIHRDVKTANILLDKEMTARLGDFGLVRTSPTDSRMTSTVFGTSAYMAPEAFRGDVSVKMDVFSVGVVFLELLTALPPYDVKRDGADIVTFVEDAVEDTIQALLDPVAEWDVPLADLIYELAKHCLESKRERPFMAQVIEKLEKIAENVSEA